MKAWTVSLTLTVHADTEDEAKDEFEASYKAGQYSADSFDVEREPEADRAEQLPESICGDGSIAV